MEIDVSKESESKGHSRPSAHLIRSRSTDLDVVNLSSQLVSLELLSQDKTSHSRKRVRFEVPKDDNDGECSDSKIKRKIPPEVKIEQTIQKAYYLRSKFVKNEHPKARHRKILKLSRHDTLTDSLSTGDDTRLSVGDGSKELSSRKTVDTIGPTDVIPWNKNQNCAVKVDKRSTKGSRITLRKSKSDSSLHELKKRSACKPTKRKKVVVAKKSGIRGKQRPKHNVNRKRKSTGSNRFTKGDSISSKKRKVSPTKAKSKKRSNNMKNKTIAHKKSGKTSKSRSPSKSKQLQDRIKKAKERVRKAKVAKQKVLQTRLKTQMKRTAQKKAAMKQKLAKKRKENKNKSRLTNKKRKANVRKTKPKPKRRRRRKIKITPIERELDVVEPLRISLLKYITFEKAYKGNYECCRKYCWDKWEEVNMEDIIDDHD